MQMKKIIFFEGITGFELKAMYLLGRCSYCLEPLHQLIFWMTWRLLKIGQIICLWKRAMGVVKRELGWKATLS
jgi:hypothetical protein